MTTVLVVDDEELIRKSLRALLEREGVEVVEAASGREALRAVSSNHAIDAVISDVRMPGIDGLAFYDTLVERIPRLASRVVFLTGATWDPEVLHSIEQRGVPVLSKTDDIRLVLDAVRVSLLRPGR